jgi:hypothetical protein
MVAGVRMAFGCAALVFLALLAIPLWLLSGVPDVAGLVILAGFAALAGVGLGLSVRAWLRGDKSGSVAAAGSLNALLVFLATAILWMWGRSLAESPCPTC